MFLKVVVSWVPTGGGWGRGECLWPLRPHRVGTGYKSVVFLSLETQTSYFSTHLFISEEKKTKSHYKMLFYKMLNGRKYTPELFGRGKQ